MIDQSKNLSHSYNKILNGLASKSTKLIYKLVIEALKFKPVLDELILKTQIEKREKWIGKGRCLCLVYDFLIGSGVKEKGLQ